MANTINTKVELEGADEVKAALDDLGAAGEAAMGRIAAAADAAGSAGTKIDQLGESGTKAAAAAGAAGTQLEQSFANAGPAIEGLIAGLGRVTGVLGEVLSAVEAAIPKWGELAAVIGAVAAGFELGKSADEATLALENQARAIGLTTQQLQGWQFAAKTVGLGSDQLAAAFERFNQKLGAAQAAQQKMTDAADAGGNAVDKARVAQEKLNLGLATAQAANVKAADSVVTLTDGIDKASFAVDKASEAHRLLVVQQNDLSTSGKGLTQTADQVTAAHNKIVDSAHALAIAQEGLVTSQTKVQEGQTAAVLAGQKYKIAQDEARIASDTVTKVTATQGEGLLKLAGVLGVTGVNAQTNVQSFLNFADGINALATPQEKATEMLGAFGRSWANVLPLISLGSVGILKLVDQLQALALTDPEKEMGGKFTAAFATMSTAIGDMKLAVGNIIGQVFVPVMNAISNFVIRNQDVIRGIAEGWAAFVGPLWEAQFRVIVAVLDAVMDVFRALGAVADSLAGSLNEAFGTKFTGGMVLFGTVAISVLGPMNLAFLGITAALGLVQAALDKVFGAEMSQKIVGWGIVGAAAVYVLGGAVSNVIAMLGGVAGTVGLPFVIIVAGVLAVTAAIVATYVYWDSLKAKATEVAVWLDNNFFQPVIGWFRDQFQQISDVWNAIVNAITTAAAFLYHAVVDPWVTAFNFVKGLWTEFTAWIGGQVAQIVAFLKPLTDALTAINSLITGALGSSPGAAGGGAVVAAAGGGFIRGPGTGTSDSILARVSAGEFVVRAPAVAHYGLNLLHALNGLRLAPGFAMGGLAGLLGGLHPAARPLGFAGGGLVAATGGGGTPVHLHLDGHSFAMTADQDVAEKLVRAARAQGMRSGGKKPSWYRG